MVDEAEWTDLRNAEHRRVSTTNALWTVVLLLLHANGKVGRTGRDWQRVLDRVEDLWSASCCRGWVMSSKKEIGTLKARG